MIQQHEAALPALEKPQFPLGEINGGAVELGQITEYEKKLININEDNNCDSLADRNPSTRFQAADVTMSALWDASGDTIHGGSNSSGPIFYARYFVGEMAELPSAWGKVSDASSKSDAIEDSITIPETIPYVNLSDEYKLDRGTWMIFCILILI